MKTVGFTQDAVVKRGMHFHQIPGATVMQASDESYADLRRSLGGILCDLTVTEVCRAHGVFVQPQRVAPFFIAPCPYPLDGGSCDSCGGSGRLVF